MMASQGGVEWERKLELLTQVSKLGRELLEARRVMDKIVAHVHQLGDEEKDRLHHKAHDSPHWPQLGNIIGRALLGLLAPRLVSSNGMTSDRRRRASALLVASAMWLFEKGPCHVYHFVFLLVARIAERMQDLGVEAYDFMKYKKPVSYLDLEAFIQNLPILGETTVEA